MISLRPSGGHDGLRRAAARAGARLLALSPLRLRALPTPAREAALAAPLLVFTSPAAVRFAAPLTPRPGQRCFAVGRGTALALQRVGYHDVHWPAQAQTSEGLLALPALQQLEGCEVGLVTAPGGRGLIAEALLSRGARLHRVDVYRREVRPLDARQRRRLAGLPPCSALLVSSGEALEALWAQLTDAERARLRRHPAVASSGRLQSRLQALGFATVWLAADAGPHSLLAALQAHVSAGRVPVG